MRLQATLRLQLPAEAILRERTVWDRIRGAFGGKVDLTSDRVRPLLQATAVVDQSRAALKRLKVDNAVSLIVDDTVLFSDVEGKPDDLGDLMLAMSEYAPVLGSTFRFVRFAAEHSEAGLHHVIEIHALGEHPRSDPAASIYVGARIEELEPRPGEAADAYRERVTPLVGREGWIDGYRHQFESFVARLGDAMRAAFPEATVVEERPEAKVVRPTDGAAPTTPPAPGHRAYDPHAHYYPSPYEPMISGLMLGMFLTTAFHPPFIHVVHPSGAPIAPADQLGDHQGAIAPDAADPGAGHDGGSGDADLGDAGGDLGDSSGSDLGDGDFGGFD